MLAVGNEPLVPHSPGTMAGTAVGSWSSQGCGPAGEPRAPQLTPAPPLAFPQSEPWALLASGKGHGYSQEVWLPIDLHSSMVPAVHRHTQDAATDTLAGTHFFCGHAPLPFPSVLPLSLFSALPGQCVLALAAIRGTAQTPVSKATTTSPTPSLLKITFLQNSSLRLETGGMGKWEWNGELRGWQIVVIRNASRHGKWMGLEIDIIWIVLSLSFLLCCLD